MPEMIDPSAEPLAGEEQPESGVRAEKRSEVTWNDVAEETKRELYLWGLGRARGRSRDGLSGDDLPPVDDRNKPAPPVDTETLRRLASDQEMSGPEVSGLYALIDEHRGWYEAYLRLLDEEQGRKRHRMTGES